MLDPHKGLFLPYGTGALLVRDGETLKRAHALSADYMPTMQADEDLTDFNLLSPELSRDFRGLRVWLPLKLHGAGPFRANLEEKLALARWAGERLREIPGIEILAEPQLSIVAFRQTRPGATAEELDRRNLALLDRINGRRRVYLTGTKLKGRFAIRICVLSFRTHRDRMEQALEDIRGRRDPRERTHDARTRQARDPRLRARGDRRPRRDDPEGRGGAEVRPTPAADRRLRRPRPRPSSPG